MIAFFARLSCDSRGFSVVSRVSADDRSFRESASASRQDDDITTSWNRLSSETHREFLFISPGHSWTLAQSYNRDNKLYLSAVLSRSTSNMLITGIFM